MSVVNLQFHLSRLGRDKIPSRLTKILSKNIHCIIAEQNKCVYLLLSSSSLYNNDHYGIIKEVKTGVEKNFI